MIEIKKVEDKFDLKIQINDNMFINITCNKEELEMLVNRIKQVLLK